jgi:hypothetical protein
MGFLDSIFADVLQVTQEFNNLKEELTTSLSAAIDPAGELRSTVDQIHTDVKDKVSGVVSSYNPKNIAPEDITKFINK